MSTEINKAVRAVEKDAQYDQQAKKLLGHKIILAHILVSTVEEFHGMNPKDVVAYIEGEPYIGVVPVDPGLTNKKQAGEEIAGFNTEDSETNEGMIRFDVVFYVRMKDGIAQMIINLEAQRKEPSDYHILNRAIFYVSRLISSQKGKDFVNSNYNDIKRTYSIWVCMNVTENCMQHISLSGKDVLGSYKWKGDIELFNIVMIGLSSEIPEHDKKYELHRLLGTMFSKTLTADQKLDVMESEYGIPMEEDIKEDFTIMCNLSQGIREETEKEVKTEMIISMYENGIEIDQIAVVAKKSKEEIETILEGNVVTV